MTNHIDQHIGKRLRGRRRVLGLTQLQLGQMVDVRFQQIQKYEKGANRVSASRLYELAEALDVPITYFYVGLKPGPKWEGSTLPPDVMEQKETQDLVRVFSKLSGRVRMRLIELAKALAPTAKSEGAQS